MYKTVFTQNFTDNEVVIMKEDREEFKKIVISFLGPNSGWSNYDFNCNFRLDPQIDACKIK